MKPSGGDDDTADLVFFFMEIPIYLARDYRYKAVNSAAEPGFFRPTIQRNNAQK